MAVFVSVTRFLKWTLNQINLTDELTQQEQKTVERHELVGV